MHEDMGLPHGRDYARIGTGILICGQLLHLRVRFFFFFFRLSQFLYVGLPRCRCVRGHAEVVPPGDWSGGLRFIPYQPPLGLRAMVTPHPVNFSP
jgi:hypothetical protein